MNMLDSNVSWMGSGPGACGIGTGIPGTVTGSTSSVLVDDAAARGVVGSARDWSRRDGNVKGAKIEPIPAAGPPIDMEAAFDPVLAEPLGTAALVAAARRGDRDAFGRLVEPELPIALGACAVLTRSQADAADAVQEALVSAWRGLGSLRDPLAFRAWFRTHVVRSAVRVVKRRGRVVELDLAAAAPDGELERAVERRLLGRAFDRLTADDRLLLTLRHLWDAPVAEVAAILGVPEGTVKSRTSAALERLRVAYDAETRR